MGRLVGLRPRVAALAPRLGYQPGDERARNRARIEAEPWRRWYRTARWRRLRLTIFARDLFTCQMEGCGRLEGDTSLLVCDHKTPHKGDRTLFWSERNLQTLCKPCHDSLKQREERRTQRGR